MARKRKGIEIEDTHSATAARAYALWEQEGRPHGRDLHHWLAAEREAAAASETQAPKAPKPARTAKRPAQRTAKPKR